MRLAFFGLPRVSNAIEALPSLNMCDHIWLKRGGHNHLGISRIIRNLALCRQPVLTSTFQEAVIDIGTRHGVTSEQSVSYWPALPRPAGGVKPLKRPASGIGNSHWI